MDHYVSCGVAPIRILTIDNDLIRFYNKQSHTHTHSHRNSLTTLYPHTHSTLATLCLGAAINGKLFIKDLAKKLSRCMHMRVVSVFACVPAV